MRYNAKRDANEPQLIIDLDRLGFDALRLDPKDVPGMPDLLVRRRGTSWTALVEVKVDKGRVRPWQADFMGAWTADGGYACVARTSEDVLTYYYETTAELNA